MSLDERVAQMRRESNPGSSPYSLIEKALKRDRDVLYAYHNGRIPIDRHLDEELIEIYELPADAILRLSLFSDLGFVSGFSMIPSNLYAPIRVVTSENFDPSNEFFETVFGRLFKDRYVTAATLQAALKDDPTGATWLKEMANAEFKEETLERLGVLKAIAGARNMYHALTVESPV